MKAPRLEFFLKKQKLQQDSSIELSLLTATLKFRALELSTEKAPKSFRI